MSTKDNEVLSWKKVHYSCPTCSSHNMKDTSHLNTAPTVAAGSTRAWH